MDPAVKLGLHRTYLANERTQMSWIRTALALISFGFTIAIALLSLGAASFQHRRALRALRMQSHDLSSSTAAWTAGLLMVLGIFAFVLALL